MSKKTTITPRKAIDNIASITVELFNNDTINIGAYDAIMYNIEVITKEQDSIELTLNVSKLVNDLNLINLNLTIHNSSDELRTIVLTECKNLGNKCKGLKKFSTELMKYLLSDTSDNRLFVDYHKTSFDISLVSKDGVSTFVLNEDEIKHLMNTTESILYFIKQLNIKMIIEL